MRNDKIKFCLMCKGIALCWNVRTQGWTARYVDGGYYCTCSDAELEDGKQRDRV